MLLPGRWNGSGRRSARGTEPIQRRESSEATNDGETAGAGRPGEEEIRRAVRRDGRNPARDGLRDIECPIPDSTTRPHCGGDRG